MCEPMTIAGLGLTGASMVAKMAADSQVQGARSGVGASEARRQEGFEAQSQNLFKDSLANVQRDKQEADRTAAEDKRTSESVATLEAAPNPTNPSDVAEATDSSVVKGSNARQLIKALNLGKLRAGLAAKVNAYGDANMNTGITLGRNGMKQGQVGTAAQRSAALLPGEYDTANRAGDGLFALGDALGVAGKVAGTAGAFGAGPTWSSLFDAGGATNVTPNIGSGPVRQGGYGPAWGGGENSSFFGRIFRPSV